MNGNRTQFDLMRPIFDAFRKIETKELSSTQRMLLIGLYSFMDGDGYCYPSYKAIGEITGLSKNAISTNLKKLVDAGWITYKQGGVDSSNQYQLNLEKIGLIDKTPDNVKPIRGNEELKNIDGRYMTEKECRASNKNWNDY